MLNALPDNPLDFSSNPNASSSHGAADFGVKIEQEAHSDDVPMADLSEKKISQSSKTGKDDVSSQGNAGGRGRGGGRGDRGGYGGLGGRGGAGPKKT